MHDGQRIIHVTGEVDAANSHELLDAVLGDEDRAARSAVVLDLAGVTFLDSHGISDLLRCRFELDRRGQTFELRNPRRNVLRAFVVAGIDDALTITTQDASAVPEVGAAGHIGRQTNGR